MQGKPQPSLLSRSSVFCQPLQTICAGWHQPFIPCPLCLSVSHTGALLSSLTQAGLPSLPIKSSTNTNHNGKTSAPGHCLSVPSPSTVDPPGAQQPPQLQARVKCLTVSTRQGGPISFSTTAGVPWPSSTCVEQLSGEVFVNMGKHVGRLQVQPQQGAGHPECSLEDLVPEQPSLSSRPWCCGPDVIWWIICRRWCLNVAVFSSS